MSRAYKITRKKNENLKKNQQNDIENKQSYSILFWWHEIVLANN